MFFSFISSRLNIIGNQVYQKQKTKNSKRKTGSYSEKLSYSQKKKIESYLKSKSAKKNK